jgi:hypothetical protein
MKRQLIFLQLAIFFFISCKKEDLPPPELIGRWEDRYSYVEYTINDSIFSRTDTIPLNTRYWTEYTENYKLHTNSGFPNCEGTFKLIRGKKFIEGFYPCHVFDGIDDGKYVLKIYYLNADTLITEGSFENGLYRTISIKI